MNERYCICGDTEDQHIDNSEQCVISGCGCKEFESIEPEEGDEDFPD